ncbi:hypothetical protein A6P39_013450 [Streptomyces sp. FXJ1.172]|uniref:hypothetical protein n=1 Tax=Streptomyces sp. FXJ1.172 TaxID=710705 RepID=UPI0007CF7999|nr:hypothetical protein [Streptomyces sp. FXJ1.172]WEO94937.1 hypothetical protein A6P39_013450 [Streptomyces sp. FXJ1.172]
MAWDEWEQLKARAAEGESPHMRLDQLAAAGGGGGTGDLVVHQDDLGAVGHEANLLYDDVKSQADIAAPGSGKGSTGSTMQAAAALKSHGFQTGGALETTVEMWTSQVKSVLQACAHISDHLDYTRKRHSEDDAEIGAVLRGRDGSAVSVSQLNEYFK